MRPPVASSDDRQVGQPVELSRQEGHLSSVDRLVSSLWVVRWDQGSSYSRFP